MTAWDRFNVHRLTIPGKAFVLGEYAVLGGGEALIATLPPRFELTRASTASAGSAKPLRELAPESPARLFASQALGSPELSKELSDLLESRFNDPHRGHGGFGGSTAEFALIYAAIRGVQAPVAEIWSAYRGLQPRASGADLAAQWLGGVVIADPVSSRAQRLEPARASALFRNFFVFSAAHQAGRKVKTHEHLDALQRNGLEQLARSQPLAEGLLAAKGGDFDSFARAINEYAQILRSMGLEHPRTTEDRAAFRDVPGVCAVKGTGAMQADALIVFGDLELRSEDVLRALAPVAEARDLRLVASGWSEEKGIAS